MTLLTILNAAKLQMARAQYLRHARRAMPERTFGPDDIWHSWDTHPWKHPWLSRDNMARMKQFSSDFLAKERANNQHADPARLKTGFVGNIANCMYTRAVPLRKAGWSLRKLSRHHGYSPGALGHALHVRWPKAQRLIADALGTKPEEIWPTRYQGKSS